MLGDGNRTRQRQPIACSQLNDCVERSWYLCLISGMRRTGWRDEKECLISSYFQLRFTDNNGTYFKAMQGKVPPPYSQTSLAPPCHGLSARIGLKLGPPFDWAALKHNARITTPTPALVAASITAQTKTYRSKAESDCHAVPFHDPSDALSGDAAYSEDDLLYCRFRIRRCL